MLQQFWFHSMILIQAAFRRSQVWSLGERFVYSIGRVFDVTDGWTLIVAPRLGSVWPGPHSVSRSTY